MVVVKVCKLLLFMAAVVVFGEGVDIGTVCDCIVVVVMGNVAIGNDCCCCCSCCVDINSINIA